MVYRGELLYLAMIGENRQSVTNEPVEFAKNNRWKFKTAGKLPIILEESLEYTLNV